VEKNNGEDLVKIKKHEKKEKPKKDVKIKSLFKKAGSKDKPKRLNSTPRANGVKLDFTNEAPRVNRYYMALSKKFSLAKVVSAFLLCVFLLFMLVFYRKSITYDNLMYLVRDLDMDVAVSMGAYNDISYEQSFNLDFSLFRQRIAVCSNTGFYLYSRAGSMDLRFDENLTDPRVESGDRYALVYDAGGRSYSLYTSVTRVRHSESKFDIALGAVSDSGAYALLTKNDESRYLITVFDRDFVERGRYYKDKLVMDMAIDKKGEYIAAVSADVGTSAVSMQVMLSRIGTEKSTQLEYEGMMPLCVRYTESGKLFVLCDCALLVFEGEKEVARVDFGGMVPGYFALNGDIAAVSFAENVTGTENILKVFDTEGSELYNIKISGKIVGVETDGSDAVYCVCETRAVKLSLGDGETKSEKISVKPIDFVPVPGSLILCSPTGTHSLFFKD